jgi:signal transduction histidine kinase/DNA-binding response OmpR family regulator/HPt (histidine-containing phosphotransfer) domain-containing protein
MKKLKQFIHRYIFSDAIPLEAKLLNVVYLCGMIFASASIITRILMGASLYLVLLVVAIDISIAWLMYICNRFHLHRACTLLTIILVCDIMLPAAYFFLGGVAGSSLAYFILSLVLIFLLSRGKIAPIFLATHIMLVIGCYYFSYRYPDLVIPLGDSLTDKDLRIYLDHIQSFLVVGGCIGIIIKFQTNVYLKAKEKGDNFNRDLLQQDKLSKGVNNVAGVLFGSEEDLFKDSVQKSMEILARCIEVDRMFIWESRIIGESQYYKPIFQWVNDPALWVHDTSGFSSDIYKDDPDWHSLISKGLFMNGPIRSLPTILWDIFAPFGAVSSLGIPIILRDQVWGFVSFDDCHRERHFSDSEREILHSGVMLLANAVVRNEMTQSLIKAKEEALASTKAKSDFLARMSHEIRTPLNAILGLSEVELQNNLSERTHINLEKIYSSGSHLLEIVNDILDISKIETRNFEILPAQYELYQLISDTVQLNLPRIGSKPITFSLDIAYTIPSKLFGDELRLRQILTNLLSNAFKYTEKGEVCLRISWERREDTAVLYFAVEDTGRGIKQEDMGKLFSEYIQLDAAANRRIEGTGLGLSIVYGLVDMMGGKVTVESEYGRGSVFRVVLPQKIIDETALGEERVKELRAFRFQEIHNRSQGNNIVRSWMPYGKVLVVDDVVTNLDVMTGLLVPYGLTVDTVSSGAEAVERIRSGEPRYDLVFMDHMMPGMDGVEAIRIIRDEIGSEYALKVPVVVVTANAITGNREMFLGSGFTDFISKPVDIKLLDITLNQWIRDRQNGEMLKEAEEQVAARERTGDGDDKTRRFQEHAVKGVDLNAVIELYGDMATCISIFKSFVSNTPSLMEKLSVYLDTSLPDYTIAIHGLKGACSAICANEVTALAKELEMASKEGRLEYVRSRHGELEGQVGVVTESLRVLVEEWEADQVEEEREVRTEPDRQALGRLSAAAAESNANRVEEILDELEAYRYEKGEDLIRWLREQAGNFEYEAIYRRLGGREE